MSEPASERQSQSPVETPFFIVPCPRNGQYFVRSENEPVDSVKALCEDSGASHRRIVVHGESGVGKTASVVEFAHRHHEKHPDCSIFWLEAATSWRFEHDLINIGIQTSLFENVRSPEQLEALLPKSTSVPSSRLERDALSEVTDYLSSPRSRRWMLIIDGVDDDAEFFDISGEDLIFAGSMAHDPPKTKLIHYLPYSRMGTIIFVSRSAEIGRRLSGTSLQVEVLPLTNSDAEKMLRQQIAPFSKGNADMEQLHHPPVMSKLGQSPLDVILTLIAAALTQSSVDELILKYEAALENWIRAEISVSVNPTSSHGDQQSTENSSLVVRPGPLFLTRVIEMMLGKFVPGAHKILLLGAWFDTDSVPMVVLERFEVFAHASPSEFQDCSAADLRKGKTVLTKLGFIIDDHLKLPLQFRKLLIRLMQIQQNLADTAIEAMCCIANVSSTDSSWYKSLSTLSQAMHVLRQAEPENEQEFGIRAGLAERTCEFLLSSGMQSRLLLQLAYSASRDRDRESKECSLMNTLPLQLVARIHIARAEFKDAEAALHVSLQRWEKVTKQSPGLITLKFGLLNKMAHVLRRQEKNLDAVLFAKAALDHVLSFCDADDSLVLSATVEVGGAYQAIHLYEDAASTYETALKKLETFENLSPDLRETYRTVLHNYTGVLVAQGKYSEAETTCNRVISALSETDVSDRSSLILALVSLIKIQYQQTNLDHARVTAERAIKLSERVTDRGDVFADPYTLEWMAIVLDTEGKSEAGEYYVKAIRAYEDEFGLGDYRAKKCFQNYAAFQAAEGPGKAKFRDAPFQDFSTYAPAILEMAEFSSEAAAAESARGLKAGEMAMSHGKHAEPEGREGCL